MQGPESFIARHRRAVLAAAVLAVGVFCASAASAEQRYAVLSLIGDRMTVVAFRFTTGSNLDRNDRQEVPIGDASLDNVALLAADDALKKAHRGTHATLLASRDPALYRLQDRAIENPAELGPLLESIRGLLQGSQATRLLLVTKHRAPAQFGVHEGFIGSGSLVGLGFYVDDATSIGRIQERDHDVGFIAPYAYLTVTLVDAQSLQVLRRNALAQSTLIPTAAGQNPGRAWQTFSAAQKSDLLQREIRRAVEAGVADVLVGE